MFCPCDTHNQLDRITKSRVHQTTNGLSQLHTQLFCRKAQQRSQWNNGQEVDDKDCRWVGVQRSQNDSRRDEDQKDVDVVARQREPCQAHEVGRHPHVPAVILSQGLSTIAAAQVSQAVRCIADERRALVVAIRLLAFGGGHGARAAVLGEGAFDTVYGGEMRISGWILKGELTRAASKQARASVSV